MKHLILFSFLFALTIGGCSTIEKPAFEYAAKVKDKICKEDEGYRKAFRARAYAELGIYTGYACVPAEERPPFEAVDQR